MRNKIITLILISIFSVNCFADGFVLNKSIQQTVQQVYNECKSLSAGKNADYIPELAKVDTKLFGIVIATVDGKILTIGDADIPFAIESISKPFVYILALQDHGEKIISEKIGLNATGHSFNSLVAIEEKSNHLQNPLVNAGAIQVTSFIKGQDSTEKWQRVLNFIKKLSGGKPYLGESVYQSETANNQHNRALVELLNSYGMISGDPSDALDRYTKACSIMITARQLALMGATLANKGIHPLTHEQIIQPRYVQNALSTMVANGLYENSGSWFWTVGLPAKSGVGGGLLAVVPNKMAIVVFSPPLDEAGNSVRAQKAITELAKRWNLHMLS